MTKIILAELAVIDPEGTPHVLHFSDEPMLPFAPDDAERPNQAYDPRLIDAANISLDVFTDFDRLTSAAGGGAVTLSNNDGALSYLRLFGFGSIDLYWGEAGDPFSAFVPLLKGRAASPLWQIAAAVAGRLTLPVHDKRADLDTLIPANLYAGTNAGGGTGYEGTADGLKDTPKPLALGDLTAANLAAPWANAEDRVAQLNDGAFEGIAAIYNGGGDAALTLSGLSTGASFDAATPAADEYEEDRVRGLVKFGSVLAGAVTFDLKGASDGGYDDTPAPLIRRLLKLAGADDAEIGASFSGFEAPEKAGLWVDTRRPAWEPVEALARSMGGWCLPDRLGLWQLGRALPPIGEPAFELADDDIVDIAVDPAAPVDPVWRVTCLYARNYRVLSRGEMQGAVPGTERESVVDREWRTATPAENAGTRARFPGARELTVETALRHEADAAALAARLLAFFGPRPDGAAKRLLRCAVLMTAEALALPLGAEVALSYARDGIAANGILLGIQPTWPRRNLVTLKVWI
ncbi:MAG: hypothetical protein Q7V31_17335 [Parvibaculum sp.]|uniref:hypothetical protein n=1 Tax=Parvibaculum sp. TaxID=2024848 RepID=UPI0027285A98|nr:hypothetical protein [Parvibaculum sp.]MDO8840677.1 hypothetical protein [Parvibaculum sp.]